MLGELWMMPDFPENCHKSSVLSVLVTIVVAGQTGWPNELSVRLPFWEIGGFELTGSNPGRVKSMT